MSENVKVPEVLTDLYASLDVDQQRGLTLALRQLDIELSNKADDDVAAAKALPLDGDGPYEHTLLHGHARGFLHAGDYLRNVARALEGDQ